MDPVVHFEMSAIDQKRMADFYTKVFGWKTQVMGPEMQNYVVVQTTDTDAKTRRPTTPGAINGGFYNSSLTKFSPAPSIVISVDDIKAKVATIKAEGCKILSGPDDIPGVGTYVSFEDTEGNRVSMLQPAPRM